MADLTSVEGILEYLASTPYAATSATRLQGGSSGFIYRAVLKSPLSRGAETVVIKHVEGYASASKQWKISTTRMDFEREAIDVISKSSLISSESIIQLPTVLHYDVDTCTLIMKDLGNLPSVKSYTSKTSDNASEIGRALGTFLASLHVWSLSQPEVLKRFQENESSRRLSAAVHYGRLDAVAKQFGHDDERIKEIADKYSDQVMTSNEVLTIGDFWTGNVLVQDSPFRLYVLDFELCKPGPCAFDVGQFAAEAYTISLYRNFDGGNTLVSEFFKAYKALRPEINPADVAVKLGQHLVVITPAVGWTDDQELLQQTVDEGVELVLHGANGDTEWLEQSVVRDLYH